MKNHRLFVLMLALAAAGGCAVEKKLTEARKDYHPAIDPVHFSAVVNHPYFPLVPGTTYTFVETEGREMRENRVTVTHDTKTILGVKCTVVHDTVTASGVLQEETFDWYAQDREGTVWYFGEATKEYKSGRRVRTGGSWEAGVRGAQPGIVMPAHPKPGEPYRQEYLAGQAEDMGQIVAVNETIAVPFGTFNDCVRTKDWSRLESGAEKKWYARGLGIVRTESSSGEVSTLLSVTKE